MKATTFITQDQINAQRAIGNMLTPLYEYKLRERVIYRNWDNIRQSDQQATNSPRFT